MDFSPSPRAAELISLVSAFVTDEIEPVAEEYHRQVTAAAATGTWAESLARVAAVNAAPATLGAGSNDWRLPNRTELASLVERKCVAPAINSGIFPGTPSQSFWSGSPYALIPNLAWFVDFNAGDVGPAPLSGAKNVRLVRAGN